MGHYIIESETRPPQQRSILKTGMPFTVLVLPFPKKKTSDPNYLVAYMCQGVAPNKMFFVYREAWSLEEADSIIQRGDTTFETAYGTYTAGKFDWDNKGVMNE